MKNMKLADSITEDIWFEICLHLPLSAIYRFKCVSKVWFSILSDHNFISRWNMLNTLSLPWLFVHYAINHSQVKRMFTIAYPNAHSEFISDHQSGFSLEFLLNQVGEELYLLASSNGLVLCTTCAIEQMTLYICNPLTKKWVLLPAPPSKSGHAVTGFICDSLSLGSTACYKVIRLPKVDEGNKFEVEVFSSDLGEWNIHAVSCPQLVVWPVIFFDDIVTHNGVLYWFQRILGKILAVSVDRNIKDGISGNECRWIDLPDQPGTRCIGESEGLICYAIINVTERRSLSVWVLEEEHWYMVHKDIEFHDTLVEMECWLIGRGNIVDLINHIQVLGFNPVDKNVVILFYDKYFWAYNAKTKGYELLSHPSFADNNVYSYHSGLAFALKPRPTILPPVSW